jgi:hypothetical protein
VNWIILVLSIIGIAFHCLMKWQVARINKRDRAVHESNPVFVQAGFQYENIRLPWPFYILLALSVYKLIESIAILSGACH